MALEVVQGQSRDRLAATALADTLSGALSVARSTSGIQYLLTADEKVVVDALLVSPDHGLVAFLVADALPANASEWEEVVGVQDRLYAVLESNLRRHDTLRRGRSLAVDPQTGTVFGSQPTGKPQDVDGFYGSLDQVTEWIATFSSDRPRTGARAPSCAAASNDDQTAEEASVGEADRFSGSCPQGDREEHRESRPMAEDGGD
jgi:hypothetical protein